VGWAPNWAADRNVGLVNSSFVVCAEVFGNCDVATEASRGCPVQVVRLSPPTLRGAVDSLVVFTALSSPRTVSYGATTWRFNMGGNGLANSGLETVKTWGFRGGYAHNWDPY
jgi:hypothetical protein